VIRLDGDALSLPGLATAHSHAFQRALRGRTHRPLAPSRGGASFWSWRGLMYELAAKLDPDTIYALSRYAYVELAMSGVTAVGEFHYVHHQPDGEPYDDRTALADAVVRAAIDAGLRVCLLRVLYQRPGLGRALEPTQRRFSDADVDDALRDVETLRARWAAEPRVRVGVAPHSVRAVPLEGVRAGAAFAEEHSLPFHMHVSEQRREVRECLAEHGRRPVQLLADEGVLTDRFVGVHATHLDAREIAALGASRAFACVCRTTERDLGDGLPSLTPMLASSGAPSSTPARCSARRAPRATPRSAWPASRPRTASRSTAPSSRARRRPTKTPWSSPPTPAACARSRSPARASWRTVCTATTRRRARTTSAPCAG